MKHIKVYESFINPINEGVSLNDIIKLADRELIEGMFPGRKFKKSGTSVYFAEENDKSKLHITILRAFAQLNAKNSNGDVEGEVMLNTFKFTKKVTPQQQAADKNIYDGSSVTAELIDEIKEAWVAVMNKVTQVEIMAFLEKKGWKVLK
jgi:hypothetical protein